MYKKHTFEERLIAVQRYLTGESSRRISQDLGINLYDIIVYVAKYNMYGEAGLRKQPNIRPTYSLKLQVVQDYHEHCLSLAKIVVKYGVSISSVKRWSHIAKEQGYEALAITKPRGRSKNMSKQTKPKELLTELEKLQAEVRYLRAENDLLKKVKALVEQREAQNRKIGRKPSKN